MSSDVQTRNDIVAAIVNGIKREVMVPLNHELGVLLTEMQYDSPFKIAVGRHAFSRMDERLVDVSYMKKFGTLLRNIVKNGLCELLFYHRRYLDGDSGVGVEFILDDLVVPVILMPEYVKIATIFVIPEGHTRIREQQIDVSSNRFTGILT